MTRPTLTFDGPGNVTGPRTRQQCNVCGAWKANSAFKLNLRNGYREKICRACRGAREREIQRLTPIHVRRASAMGPCADSRWGAGSCEECGERLCWDTDGRGGLVALDFRLRTVHEHQPGNVEGPCFKRGDGQGLAMDIRHKESTDGQKS